MEAIQDQSQCSQAFGLDAQSLLVGRIGWFGNRALSNPIQEKNLQEAAEMGKVFDFIKKGPHPQIMERLR